MPTLTVITGPPCAGKTTYAREHARPGDVVIDFDELARALGSGNAHDHHPSIREITAAAWSAAIRRALTEKQLTTWIIDSRPTSPRRSQYDNTAATYINLTAGRDELHRRADASGRPPDSHNRIDTWFDRPLTAHATTTTTTLRADKTGKTRNTGWEGGSTRAWRKIRAAVLKRDGYICQLRLEPDKKAHFDGCTHKATHAHHLDGKAMGDDPNRIVAACAACNQRIGDPTRLDPEHEPHTRW